MTYQIVTRSTDPQVVDLSDWRARYHQALGADDGQPVQEVRAPTKAVWLTQQAIEASVRDYARGLKLKGPQIAACIARAVRVYRAGHSAATSIQRGKQAADQLRPDSDPTLDR